MEPYELGFPFSLHIYTQDSDGHYVKKETDKGHMHKLFRLSSLIPLSISAVINLDQEYVIRSIVYDVSKDDNTGWGTIILYVDPVRPIYVK